MFDIVRKMLLNYHKKSGTAYDFWTQPTFQRRINVVSKLWINVEITLTRRSTLSKIRRRIFNVARRCYNVGVRRRENVEATLIQRDCINVASTFSQLQTPTLFQRGLNISKSCINISPASDKYGFVNS